MNYSITLLNYIFDRENDNAVLFDTAEELRSFIATQPGQVKIENVNFRANNLINANVFFDGEQTGASLLALLNYNYAVVEDDENNAPLYFWVMNSKQDSGTNIELDLRIDAWNTYIYEAGELYGLINRTHLDRFIQIDDKVYYNFNADSPLFEREEVQGIAKRATNLVKLKAQYGNETLDNFIYENIDHWVYIYFSPGDINSNSSGGIIKTGNIQFSSAQVVSTSLENGDTYDGGFIVFCAPFYKPNAKKLYVEQEIGTRQGEFIEWNMKSIYALLSINNQYAKVFAIKHSPIGPFLPCNIPTEQNENGGLNILMTVHEGYYPSISTLEIDATGGTWNPISYGGKYQVIQVTLQSLAVLPTMACPVNLENWSFEKSKITNENEPKMLNEDFSKYRLFLGGETFDLPISKTSPQPTFKYFEPFSPDITKGLVIFNPESSPMTEPVFTDYAKKNFTGFSFTLDLSQWIVQDNLQTYLANNKNNLQIFNNQQTQERVSNFLRMSNNLIQGALSSQSKIQTIRQGFSEGINQVNLDIKQSFERENYRLTLDNMEASPDTIRNMNSNPVLLNGVNELGVYIEVDQALDFEQKVIKDYLISMGYSYGKFGKIFDFIKTRRYYNYIEATLTELTMPASEQVKDIIRSIFSKGIRIWRGSTFEGINLDLNNIEISLMGAN